MAEVEDNNTRDHFYKIIAWSFRWLAKGVHPDSDWNGNNWSHRQTFFKEKQGKPLAGGFKAVLIKLKGDLEFLYQEPHALSQVLYMFNYICRHNFRLLNILNNFVIVV